MIAKFNPTGTHVHKGFLKVRIDLYPDIGGKTYAIHHILVPVFPPKGYQGEVDKFRRPIDQDDYNNWIDSLPKIWQLNPALCHLIKVKESSTKADLTNYLEQIYTPTLIKTLDDSLILPNSAHLISPLMRSKSTLTTEKIVTKDIEDLILSANSRFAALVLDKDGEDKGLDILSRSITVGAAAIGRGSVMPLQTYTCVDESNSADGTGTIDEVEIWLDYKTGTNDVWFGMFSASGNVLTCRDSESGGDIASGSKQTVVGLSINIVTGDYIGAFQKTGQQSQIETDASGGAGFWYFEGECIDPSDSETFTLFGAGEISLYGTGEEVAVAIPRYPAVNFQDPAIV